jgi:hypothetical protein
MKTCSETERMFPFDCGVDDKNSTKQSLAKHSRFIDILIPIPMRTQSIHIYTCCVWAGGTESQFAVERKFIPELHNTSSKFNNRIKIF